MDIFYSLSEDKAFTVVSELFLFLQLLPDKILMLGKKLSSSFPSKNESSKLSEKLFSEEIIQLLLLGARTTEKGAKTFFRSESAI